MTIVVPAPCVAKASTGTPSSYTPAQPSVWRVSLSRMEFNLSNALPCCR